MHFISHILLARLPKNGHKSVDGSLKLILGNKVKVRLNPLFNLNGSGILWMAGWMDGWTDG